MLDKALLQLGQVASLQSPTESMVKTFDGWIKSWQHISDCSNNFLESTIPRGTGPLRMRNIFKAISIWMKGRQHVSDSSNNSLENADNSNKSLENADSSNNSLKNTICRGTVPLQNGKTMQYSGENSELVTISKRADSWLGGFLKRMPLKLLFTV